MFKEEVILEDDLLKIVVSIDQRKFAIEDKLIYKLDHKRLIPSDLIGKVILISAPDKKISNISKSKYVATGTWVYQIAKKQTKKASPAPAKRSRTARTKKS